MPQDRYPGTRGNPAKFDSLDVGNLAPISERGSLEAGRLFNIHHLFGDAIGTESSAVVEGISVLMGYNPTKASSALLECIDTTAISQGLHSGTIQTVGAAISKSSATTTTLATSFAAWPAYALTGGTVTNLYGLYVYGTRNSTGGTIGGMTGVAIAANAIAVSGDKVGVDIGAMSGVAGNRYGIKIAGQTGSAETALAIGISIVQPLGGAANHALLLDASASTEPSVIWRNIAQNTITMTLPTTIGASWTWTLPPDDGGVGEQLQTNGSGVTTWEDPATSTREAKILEGVLDPEVALERVRNTTVHLYRYDPEAKHVGGDYTTQFAHLVLEEAPWAARANKRSTAVLSELGHHNAAITALAARLEALEAKVA